MNAIVTVTLDGLSVSSTTIQPLSASITPTLANVGLSLVGQQQGFKRRPIIVEVGSEDYYSYASVEDADTFLTPDLSRSQNWFSLDECQKSAALVSATRSLDRIEWPGQKQSPTQPLDWPRANTGLPTNLVEPGVVPDRVFEATILLAGTLASDSSLADVDGGQQTGLNSLTVGPITLDFVEGAARARGEAADAGALRDPTADALIKPLRLAAQGAKVAAVGRPRVFGTSDQSTFVDGGRFRTIDGFS